MFLHRADLANKGANFVAYKMYTQAMHGILGRKNRRPPPHCVLAEIHELLPDSLGASVRCHESEDKGKDAPHKESED